MNPSGITAALPAQDLSRAKAFYLDEKVGLEAVQSQFPNASDGRVGLAIGDGVNQLFIYPAEARSSGEFHAGCSSGHRRAIGRRRHERSGHKVRAVRHCGDPDRERRCSGA